MKALANCQTLYESSFYSELMTATHHLGDVPNYIPQIFKRFIILPSQFCRKLIVQNKLLSLQNQRHAKRPFHKIRSLSLLKI